MPYTGNDIKISQNVYVENDIEVDDQGNLSLVTFIYQDDLDDPLQSRTDFDSVVENLIDYYREDVVPGRNQIYAIASELERSAEALRRAADNADTDYMSSHYDLQYFDDDDEQDLRNLIE